nr:hypothetical protein [uncultured Olsenella sp.]
MPALIDLAGKRFGRLTVIKRTGTRSHHPLWLCRCDCGNEIEVTTASLQSGATRSCGCLRKELAAGKAKKAGNVRGVQLVKHGHAGERLYGVWKSMRQRCNNPHNKFYADYGGRGINVCPEWDDYAKFRSWAMSHGYRPDAAFGETTLDRADNMRGYSPDNCRFVDLKKQANNRRKRGTGNAKVRT